MDEMIQMNFPLVRIPHAFVTLALAFLPLACAQSGGDAKSFEGVTPESMPAPTPGNPGVYGTYRSEAMGVGLFDTLVLMTDHRYHTSHKVVCVKAPCLPIEEDGTFELYVRDRTRYIAFMPQRATDALRYEVAFEKDLVRLRHILPGATWNSMNRSDLAWCAGPKDCTMQPLPPGPCGGGYACNENQCAWKCGGPTDSAVK
jgi:hypothetical protein